MQIEQEVKNYKDRNIPSEKRVVGLKFFCFAQGVTTN